MFVYVQKCTYTVNKIVRIREQELFVYVNSLFVYVNLGSNTSQFAQFVEEAGTSFKPVRTYMEQALLQYNPD